MKRGQNQGTVYKVKDGRDKPYLVYTPSYIDNNKRKRKLLGSFATKTEAENYLNNYIAGNKNKKHITLKDIYNIIYKEKVNNNIPENTLIVYRKTAKTLESLFNTPINSIKYKDLNEKLSGYTKPTFLQFKMVLNTIFEYALKNEIIDKNIVSLLSSKGQKTPKKREQSVFTYEEIEKLWDLLNKGDIYAKRHARLLLILLYTGCRVSEILNMKRADVHLKEDYMFVRDGKTESSIRKVYIHPKIKHIIKYLLNNNYGDSTKLMDYNSAKCISIISAINTYIKKLGMNHSTHSCRHTFLSRAFVMALQDKVNFAIIDLACGHKQKSVAMDYYIHLSDDIIKNELFKIDY
ncbi:MAG: tyrosine-type recombinase/integrase [Abditibacteriota bacterium]|nr:tyrosine-type recombinase/integrase [Abditibacteriota bacterium]